MAQTIKSLIAPLIMMAVLALLPACWGLKRPSPVTSTIELCTTNPFQESCDETYEIERIVKINECIAGGAAATATCADAVAANSCISDPFAVACEANPTFAAYIARARNARVAYCQLPTADSTLCAGVAGSTLLDTECLDSPLEAPAYSSCSTRPSVVRICADDPFTRTGCGNVSTIEALRIAHCEDSATAWDDDCVEATYTGATVARNTACLTHGIDANAGGHADCAMRGNVLLACSETTPFAYDVCDAVEGIGMKQMAACLADVDADDGCVALIMQTCEDTPLAGVSCAGLDGYTEDLNMFCSTGNNAMLGGCAMTPARLSACAAGTLGIGECDTDVIAPLVCASSGANANPFVAFCASTNNIGGGDYTAIRQTALSTCFDGMSDDDNDICQNTIMARRTLATDCLLDTETFKPRCDYTQYETAREGFCPESDPFAYTGCDNVGIINTRRATYCNMPINAWKSDCTGGSFGGTHDSTTAEGTACRMFGTDETIGGNSSCDTNVFAKSFCETNDPLDSANAGCEDLTDFLMVVQTYCTANEGMEVCNVVYTDWTGSTFTPEFPLIAVASAASTDTLNQFLSGLTKGAVVPTITGFTALTGAGDQKANHTHLALNDVAHGFGGQDDDGVMFFGGQRTDSTYRYYAGIYSSTDLGVPLTEASQNAVWRAWMRTSGKDPKNEYFELEIDYTPKAIGTLSAFFQSTSGDNTLYYDIDGDFDINGVITGDVAIGTKTAIGNNLVSSSSTLGKLTGLIGAQGVVAAFVSNTSTTTADGGANPFVGGFVGIPALADHDAFRNYYDDNLTTGGVVAFVEGMAGGLAVTDLTFVDTDQFTSFPVVDAGNGFALLFGETAGGDDRYRAGLLSGTNLGAPLLDAPSDTTWEGSVHVSRHLDSQTDLPLPVSVTLTVDFSTGRIGLTNQTIKGDETLTIAGLFRAGSNNPTLPVGILGGTVSYNDGATEHDSLPLIGLIGVDGAIGVFHGGTDIPMVGGFAVKPTP